jgi:OOP family OmpA-OmpF porin
LSFATESSVAAPGNAAQPTTTVADTPVIAEAPSAAPSTAAASESWFSKHLAVDNLFEIGAGLGLLFPSSNHNFRLESAPQQKIDSAAELFIRAAWLPIRFAGIEAEAAVGATKTNDDVQSYPWAIRAHAIGQLPFWRITPFALVGLGRMGNVSNRLGMDGDPLFHFGAGAKLFLTDDLLMRLDLRDNMTQKYNAEDGTLTHSPELLVGVSMTLGRPTKPLASCPSEDSDGDGIVNTQDKCPNVSGPARDGCPILDSDRDGVRDDDDKCPDTQGVAPTGCPADTDEDGFVDENDKCPKLKGDAPDGCPSDKDSDADKILDSKDKCPNEAENQNGYEDQDGCPDVIPERIKAFTGIIQGITFDHNKATIRPESKPTLESSVAVLKEYPTLRVLISGHTDTTGPRDKNVLLSQERAEAVKKYLVAEGVEPNRVETRGVGPDEPVDTNASAAGRARNRRIEFKLIVEN